LEGHKIPASECHAAGIANKVVPTDDLESATRTWAEKLAGSAPLALTASKRLLRSVGAMSFGDAITAEGIEQAPLLKSGDFREGVTAFFQKRRPEWSGS
jgi:2-(1,2-epoxy-1,2-dihydrophenyl)acetyl-CoA isomerase